MTLQTDTNGVTDDMRKFNLKKRKARASDYSHRKTLGASAAPLPDELLFLTDVLNQGGLNECTAYAAVAIRQSMKGKAYDPAAQWAEEVSLGASEDGTDLQTQLATGVRCGFSPVNAPAGASGTDNASCYLWVRQGGGNDLFDSIREAMNAIQAPLSMGVLWMQEWDSVPGGIVDVPGSVPLGGHCVKCAGWKQVNGEPMLVIQNSWGTGYGDNGLYYFPRAIANRVFGPYGIGYWSDDPDLKVKRLGLLSALYVNLLNLWQEPTGNTGNFPPPAPQPAPSPVPTIQKWASAIAVQEGANPVYHNPGNLKLTTLTESWGATPGFPAEDGGNIAYFPTQELGSEALCNFLKLGCEDELLAFHQARTLALFTKVYAGNPPSQYLEGVCAALGVPPDTQISTFLDG